MLSDILFFSFLHASFSSVQFSSSVVYDSLRPHGLQHTRPSCLSPTPRVYSNLCPLSQQTVWGHYQYLILCISIISVPGKKHNCHHCIFCICTSSVSERPLAFTHAPKTKRLYYLLNWNVHSVWTLTFLTQESTLHHGEFDWWISGYMPMP